MSRPIELALLSLLPAHGAALPPALVELAESLLAQSRHRASTLKADEEAARLYACAHLACERLKTALDLPPVDARPPVPPRIYRRLYAHLENVLPSPAAAPSSLRGTRRRPGPRGGRRAAADSTTDRPCPWVPPVARFLCAEAGVARLAPSVLAGVDAVAARRDDDGDDDDGDWAAKHATALVAAVFFLVVARARAGDAADAAPDRRRHPALRDEILALLGRARTDVRPARAAPDDFWRGWTALGPDDLDAAVARAGGRGWRAGDWYAGVAHAVAAARPAAPDADPGVDTPARRADTMLGPQYDLLSAARRLDYEAWKARMLSRIDGAVNGGS